MTSETAVSLAQAYAAAHAAAVLAEHPARGMLHLTGATRLDLINRMSTQAVLGLQSGQGAATVLTTDIGRIIDRILLYATGDGAYVLTGDGHADPLARYFMRNIFFNDDAQLLDISAETSVFGVYGPRAAELLVAAGFPEVEIPLHHWRQATIGGATAAVATAYLHRTDPIAGGGYLVTGNTSDHEAIRAALLTAGLTPIDEAAYDYLRIEAAGRAAGRGGRDHRRWSAGRVDHLGRRRAGRAGDVRLRQNVRPGQPSDAYGRGYRIDSFAVGNVSRIQAK